MARFALIFNAFVLFLISFAVGQFVCFSEIMASVESDSLRLVLTLLAGIASILCLLTGFLLLFISHQQSSKYNSTFEKIRHFILKYHRIYIGRKMLKTLRDGCIDPRQQQENLLQKIIEKNKNTIYGREFNLESVRSISDFCRKHPLTEFSRYEPFVDKIASGEKGIMTTQKVSRLVLTSGTTGKGKRIPQDEYYVEKIFIMKEALLHDVYPSLHPMQSKFRYHCNSQIRKGKGGISISAATALEDHMIGEMKIYSSPPQAFMIGTEFEASYIHLLFALRDKDIGSVWVSFISVFVSLMKFLENNWQSIVDDLSQGTLNRDLKLSPDERRNFSRALGSGDAKRAADVRNELLKGFDGIIKRLWPNMTIISTIDNIGLKQTVKKSLAKGVEVYSPVYVSSENLLGLNLWPHNDGDTEYVLYLTENVFEFIHENDMDKPDPTTYLVDEVEVGEKYEVVLTQIYGMCRYRLGDVIEISGFYQNCPKLKFLYRKATLVNLVGEKVDQIVIADSIKASLRKWNDSVELSHYCVSESSLLEGLYVDNRETERTNLFHIFFLDLNVKSGGKLPSDLMPHILSEAIDRNIYERHDFYKNYRNTNQISPPIVYFVEKRGFLKLREFILENSSASRSQFKMPLKIRTREMGEILLKNVKM